MKYEWLKFISYLVCQGIVLLHLIDENIDKNQDYNLNYSFTV